MRKETYIIVFIILLLIASVMALFSIVKTKVVKQIVYKTKTVNKIDKTKLVDWIYRNSFRCSHSQAQKYAGLILQQSYPLLIASIIRQESNFNPTATNKVGNTFVIGLAQVYCSPQHIKQLENAGIIKSIRDLFNPDTNIKAGVFILKDIIRINKGNLEKSLRMYCGKKSGYNREVLETLEQLSLEVK